jgi:curved DNA-binding protein CbpA
MAEPGPDLYRVLGVSRDATAAEITRAYRRRARAVHPDTAPPGAGAAARFRVVSEAYQVLSDPARRAVYDRASYRETAPGHSQAAPGRARPRPAGADMPPAWPRVPAGLGPLRMPALWAGPVRVEPLRAAAAGPGPGAGSQAGVAGRAGLVSRYAGSRRNGLR